MKKEWLMPVGPADEAQAFVAGRFFAAAMTPLSVLVHMAIQHGERTKAARADGAVVFRFEFVIDAEHGFKLRVRA
jgi:hypothetical protein